MKTHRGSGRRALAWAGAAMLTLATALPWSLEARPYLPEETPMPDGDPTADDQPSPTPKGNRTQAILATLDRRGETLRAGAVSRTIWLTYVRAWIRITIR